MSNLEKAIAEYKKAEEALSKAREEAMAPARKALLEDFKAAFERAPEVLAYRWTQYTPYFNDGEPCEFRVNDLEWSGKVEGEEGDEEDEDEEWNWRDAPGNPPDPCAIGDDLLEGVFGDHTEVIVRRGATDFEVNEYSHD